MSDLTTEGFNITRTQNHTYKFEITGLRPNTKHTITIDDEDYGFATRQFGKAPGADLISDADGNLSLLVLYEIEFNRTQNFELNQTQSLATEGNALNQQQNRKAVNTVINYKVIEVKSFDGLSQTQFIMKQNLILTAGPVRTLYPVE